MTNVSIRGSFAISSVFAFALALSLGLFAITAHAQEEGYSLEGGGDFGSADLSGGSDFGGYSLGGGGDFGGYSLGGSGDVSGYSLGGGSDWGGYSLGGGNDFGGYSLGGGSDFGGYSLGGGSDFGGYSLGGGSDFGGYSLGGGSDFGGYSLAGNSDFCTVGCQYEASLPDCGCPGFVDEFGHEYFESYGYSSYSTPFQSAPFYSPGFAAAAPFAPIRSFPVTNPVFASNVPAPRQQPIVSNPSSNVSNVTNTCTGNSCNTSVNNIDNSINGSFNKTVLGQATPQYPIQYTFPSNLYCQITASPSTIANGQAAVLAWTSYGAASVWLSDGIGAVAVSGTLPVRPNVSTNYTLTISGQGGTATCNTFVRVSGSYVSLSQIPYTGLDFGPFGNAFYFGGILLFALSAAYLVLYYKGGATVFAGSMLGSVTLRKRVVRQSIAAPSMFARKHVFSPKTHRRVVEKSSFSAVQAAAPKDTMSIDRSNGSPRIVISRS